MRFCRARVSQSRYVRIIIITIVAFCPVYSLSQALLLCSTIHEVYSCRRLALQMGCADDGHKFLNHQKWWYVHILPFIGCPKAPARRLQFLGSANIILAFLSYNILPFVAGTSCHVDYARCDCTPAVWIILCTRQLLHYGLSVLSICRTRRII